MLPISLQEIINSGRQEMLNHSDYNLLPKYRVDIYIVILDYSFGKQLLGWLAVLSAKKCVSYWFLSFTDPLPYRLIKLAEDVLQGKIDNTIATDEADKASELLEELGTGLDVSKYQAAYAGQAAVEALFEASGNSRIPDLQEEVRLAENVNQEVNDSNLDFWTSDPARWAVLGFAGTGWNNSFDRLNCRDFWEWWLTEAISQAWRQTQENNVA